MDSNRYSANCQALYNTWPNCSVAIIQLDRGSAFCYNGSIRKQDWGGRGGCLYKTTLPAAVVFSQRHVKLPKNLENCCGNDTEALDIFGNFLPNRT